MIRKLLLAGALVLLSLPAPAAHASPAVTVVGPRFGFSVDPDQVVLGGQLSVREFAPDWSFDPNLELGFGDDETTIAFGLEAHYHLRLSGSEWRPYVGGGLGVDFASWDAPLGVNDHSHTYVGVNAVAGVAIPAGAGRQGFAELRFGLGDLPTLKIMGGMNFGR